MTAAPGRTGRATAPRGLPREAVVRHPETGGSGPLAVVASMMLAAASMITFHCGLAFLADRAKFLSQASRDLVTVGHEFVAQAHHVRSADILGVAGSLRPGGRGGGCH